jgi:hypothetical protein
MPVTMEQVIARLDKEEPDYEFAAQLGPEMIPHLLQLVEGDDIARASKATCLASYIDTEGSAAVLDRAARSNHRALRAAAAVSLKNLKTISPQLTIRLLGDPEVGVRKWALKAADTHPSADVKAKVREIAKSDSHTELRQLASQIAEHLP